MNIYILAGDDKRYYWLLFFIISIIFLFCSACSSKQISIPVAPIGNNSTVTMEKADPAWFDQMKSLEEREQFDELQSTASLIFSSAELTDTQKAWVKYYLGRSCLEKMQGQSALFHARNSAKFLPNELKPKILLGITEVCWGNRPKGESILASLLMEHPTAEVYIGLARLNELLEKWFRAGQWYKQVINLNPGEPKWHVKYALALWRGGDAYEALTEFEKALLINPDDASIWNDKGIVNLALGRKKAALHDFNRALLLDPCYGDALLNRSNYYANQGKYDLALADCNTGLSHNPENSKLLAAKGQIYAAQKMYVKAASSFSAAYYSDRNNPEIINELAWFLATCPLKSLRNFARAVELAERAIQLSRVPDPGSYDTLAAAYAAASRFPEAIKSQNTAIKLAKEADLSIEILSDWQKRLHLYERGYPYTQ